MGRKQVGKRLPGTACALVLATALAGCPAGKAPTATKPATPRPKVAGSPAPGPARPAAPVPAEALAKALSGRATRAIAADAGVATLTGKVKLLANNGAGIISDNGGGIISNNSGAIISDNGGGVLANNGGSVVANDGAGYRVKQAAPPAELALADAVVTVHDAAGKLLTTADGAPIVAITDRTGAYRLEAPLPAENVVLRVRLWNGGELAAMAPKSPLGWGRGEAADGGPQTYDLPVDTATSLGAAYVLDRFVKGDQQTFDKLPASEAQALRDAIEAARGALTKAPAYAEAELAGLAEELRGKAPAVDRKLEDIEALLIGQARIGDGLPATSVALPIMASMAFDARGVLLLAEPVTGRIREVTAGGLLGTYADLARGSHVKRSFRELNDLAVGPDGRLYVSVLNVVYRIGADGSATPVAGNGTTARGALDVAATSTAVTAEEIAVGPDGTLYAIDASLPPGTASTMATPDRIVAVGPDGVARGLPIPTDAGVVAVLGLAVTGDGTVWSAGLRTAAAAQLRRWKPGAAASEVVGELAIGAEPKPGMLAAAPDGGVVFADPGGRIDGFAADGTATTLHRPGEPGPQEPVLPTFAKDGTLHVVDAASNRVFARGADGAWRVVAGSDGAVLGGGDVTALSLNQPLAVAFDEANRLLFTEFGGFAVKRFAAGALERVAGASRGFGGDGGPAAAARLKSPSGVVRRGDTTWVADSGNGVIRAIGPDGTIRAAIGSPLAADRTLATTGLRMHLQPGERVPADQVYLEAPRGLVLSPDGRPYWALPQRGQIWRQAADGQVELVAGRGTPYGQPLSVPLAAALAEEAEEVPALEANLGYPCGLAFDAKGDLYVAEAMGFRVRRITGLAAGPATIHRFAGAPADQVLAQQDLTVTNAVGKQAREVPLLLPLGLCFDRAGALYVSVAGTRNIAAASPTLGGGAEMPFDLPAIGALIVRIAPDGTLGVVAGPTTRFFPDPDAEDAMIAPVGLATDDEGRLAVADAAQNLLRILPPGTTAGR